MQKFTWCCGSHVWHRWWNHCQFLATQNYVWTTQISHWSSEIWCQNDTIYLPVFSRRISLALSYSTSHNPISQLDFIPLDYSDGKANIPSKINLQHNGVCGTRPMCTCKLSSWSCTWKFSKYAMLIGYKFKFLFPTIFPFTCPLFVKYQLIIWKYIFQ